MAGSADAIRELVEPALASSGLELWDVEVSRDIVRVLVDRPGGIDLDSLAEVAGQVVSPLLDDHPELTPAGRFQLEVSSPGVERTLRRVDQYRRYVGTEVSVKTTVAVDGARRHHGLLAEAGEDGIRIEPKDGPPGAVVALPYSTIDRARTVLVWGPGAAKSPKSTQAKSTQAKSPKGSKPGAVKRPAASGPAPSSEGHPPVASIDPKDAAL
jgi:ribosome maturation factor RimP